MPRSTMLSVYRVPSCCLGAADELGLAGLLGYLQLELFNLLIQIAKHVAFAGKIRSDLNDFDVVEGFF